MLKVEKTLLGGATKRRPVPDRRSVEDIPGVQVRVEVQHRQWTVLVRRSAQQRQCNRVIASQRDDLGAELHKPRHVSLNDLDRTRHIVRADADVAPVGDLHVAKG